MVELVGDGGHRRDALILLQLAHQIEGCLFALAELNKDIQYFTLDIS